MYHEQRSPRLALVFDSSEPQPNHSQHRNKDRYGQDRPDLRESASGIVYCHNRKIASDMSREQTSENEEADDIHRTRRCAQNGRQP